MNENTHGTLEGHRPRWNVGSLLMPFAGFFCGLTVALGVQGHPAQTFFWGLLVWVACCALGFLAACVAWVRAETPRSLTFLGFILNAPLPFGLLAWALLAGWNPLNHL